MYENTQNNNNDYLINWTNINNDIFRKELVSYWISLPSIIVESTRVSDRIAMLAALKLKIKKI